MTSMVRVEGLPSGDGILWVGDEAVPIRSREPVASIQLRVDAAIRRQAAPVSNHCSVRLDAESVAAVVDVDLVRKGLRAPFISPRFVDRNDWRSSLDTTESDLIVRRALARAMGGRA